MNGGKRKYEPEVVMTKKKLKTKPVLGQDGFGEQVGNKHIIIN